MSTLKKLVNHPDFTFVTTKWGEVYWRHHPPAKLTDQYKPQSMWDIATDMDTQVVDLAWLLYYVFNCEHSIELAMEYMTVQKYPGDL